MIDCPALKGVRLIQLTLPFRLRAGRVENLVDHIGVGSLHPMIGKDVQVHLILGAEDLIDTPGDKPFPGEVTGRCLELQSARTANRLLERSAPASTVGQ